MTGQPLAPANTAPDPHDDLLVTIVARILQPVAFTGTPLPVERVLRDAERTIARSRARRILDAVRIYDAERDRVDQALADPADQPAEAEPCSLDDGHGGPCRWEP